MYTDQDLNQAVQADIFSEQSVQDFRRFIEQAKATANTDEENFKLIGGFNDIFIVIACLLLLVSTGWVLNGINETLAALVSAILSWGLAEFFVRKRKMALPAIVLLITFISGVATSVLSLFPEQGSLSFSLATVITVAAAVGHWRRFQVPITIAAGLAAGLTGLAALILSIAPQAEDFITGIVFVMGLGAFAVAMHWDSQDRDRTAHQSDVAFWLHLLAAPMIIHPVFYSLGILEGNDSMVSMIAVLILFALTTTLSIAVDRRAFMVSSLIYVLYAISTVVENVGGMGSSFAITGAIMGAALLLLSAFWQKVRYCIVGLLPQSIQHRLAKAQAC